MRLKTKILIICCISILFSSVLCSITVYILVKNYSLDAAEGQSFKDAFAVYHDLEDDLAALQISRDDTVDVEVLEYIFKKQNDELLISFLADGDKKTELFNSTVFRRADLEKLPYHIYDQGCANHLWPFL